MDSSESNNREDSTSRMGPLDPPEAARESLVAALPPDEVESQPLADPIARNPKDLGKPEEVVQATEVYRRSKVSAPPVASTALSERSWGLHQHPPTAPSATELLASILRFKGTILVVWILVSAPIIAAVWTQIVPQYRARAEVRVRPIIPRLVFRTEENGMIPLYDSFVNTQVSLIRSPTVLQRVLDQAQVQTTQWYKNPAKTLVQQLMGGNADPPMERLRDGLSAQPRPRTELIDVAFADVSGQDAKVIVDAVLDQYIKYVNETTDATQDKLDRQLTDQYNSLKTEIQGRESIIAALRKSLGTETPQELVSNRRVRLDEAQARFSELRNRIMVLGWEVNEVQRAVSRDSNNVPTASPGTREIQRRYSTDAEWLRLDHDIQMAQHQIDITIMTPTHPDRARLTKNLEFAQELRRSREAQLDEQWNDRVTNGTGLVTTLGGASIPGLAGGAIPVDRQLARAKVEEQLLRAELEKQKADFNDLFDHAQSLARENAALQQKRELFDAVRQRLDQKNMERGVPGSIEILTAASVPFKPAQDRRVVFTVMALFAGLGLGGGLAFLRASRNQTIYAPKDMPQPAQTPFLGYVPLIHLKKLRRSLCDEIEQNQLLLIESVRVLRTALLSRLHGQGNTAVVVTSANEGTGKSSFTMVLGKSIAQAGRKVLIIDADLHKMTLSKRLQLLDKPGFRESLKDKTAEGLHVFPTETAGLDIMPTGKQSGGDVAFEEIANGAFRSCIGRLFERYGYDIILLDTPPILPVADAIILAGQVDGTVMVEREHVSQRAEVANALIRLGSAGGRLLGTVFVGSVSQGHYGYGYSYGHYGNRTRKP
jgi:capsular exopolysaccharide synthesis family protein